MDVGSMTFCLWLDTQSVGQPRSRKEVAHAMHRAERPLRRRRPIARGAVGAHGQQQLHTAPARPRRAVARLERRSTSAGR
eukprot:5057515-Prymnesium_polylepis.1